MRMLLLLSAAMIFVIGLIMIFDTTAADILDRSLDKSTHSAMYGQIAYAGLGILVSVVAWFIGYQNILKLSYPLLCGMIFLLILVYVPGIGVAANGARRWIGIAGHTLQPSEFVKFVIPVFLIYEFGKAGREALTWRRFLTLMTPAVIAMFLVLLEPNNAMTATIAIVMVTTLFVAGVKYRFWLPPMLALFIVAVGLAATMPHVQDRIRIYLHPETDLRGKGHQPFQAKIATGSGKLLGKGLGESLQKLNYLPEAQNDYIAAIYAEEFGFVGVVALISLYMLMTYAGFHIACRAIDQKGMQLATIITVILALQALLNLGVVSGLLPSTGLNLPFVSQGGTSLMANVMALAFLLNIGYVAEKQRRQATI